MVITHEQYLKETTNLKEVGAGDTCTTFWEAYWIKGSLLRYSGTKGCKNVQVVDMMSETNIDRGGDGT